MGKRAAHSSLFMGTLSLVVSAFGQQGPIRIEANFEPAIITLSRQTTYKVTIHGSQISPVGNLPRVNGLTISNSPRVFRSASFNKGVPSVRLEISFAAKPSRVGTFSMPAWPLSVGGQSFAVPAATLRTLPPSQEDILREEIRKKEEADMNQALFLELSLSSDYLYEGQTVLSSVNLFVWERLPVTRFGQLPQKLGDAFSQSEMKQPLEKRNVPRSNKNYHVYSWPVALTAIMEGKHELHYRMAVRVRVKERTPTSPLRNPFFNDPFFGFGREEAISVTSEKRTIEVRSLPMDARPASFRGAIGSFKTQAETETNRVTVGDPLRVTFSVSGKGNFGVMPAPEIPSTDNLKIGPPAFSFEGDENLKYEGIQRFEYIVTPLRPSRMEIPVVPFSYFDPVSQSYVDASTEPHPLRVDPGETWVDPTPTEPLATSEEQPPKSVHNLFQTESEPGEWQPTLVPSSAFRSSAFWYIQFAPLVCLATLIGWQLRQKRSTKDNLSKRLAKLRQEMKASTRLNDSSRFLRAARAAIRECVGSLVDHDRPEALARDEVVAILNRFETTEEILGDVLELFEIADAREFAGDKESSLPLKGWLSRVNHLLKRIRAKA